MSACQSRQGQPGQQGAPGCTRRQPAEDTKVDWQRYLPRDWRELVVVPFSFRVWQEYEADARRSIGYDIDQHPCHYTHHYRLTEIRSDDDESFYPVLTYGETVHAWRLRDERWLIYREVHVDDCSSNSRGFYTFASEMPK